MPCPGLNLICNVRYSCSYQPNSAQSLAALLAQHSGLTSLALRSASINHANSCIIAPSLALCTGLTSLELAFNSLAAPDILLFTSSFPPSLLSLDLSANPLFAAGTCHLADALSFTPGQPPLRYFRPHALMTPSLVLT